MSENDLSIPETLPAELLAELRMPSREEAFRAVHAPSDTPSADRARTRLKFEELLYLQLLLVRKKQVATKGQPGVRFALVGDLFNAFYAHHLPFELTGAQKRVLREI